jgi:hypothetical protein
MCTGNADAVKVASKLDASSGITADDIATTVYDDSKKGKHYILGARRRDRIVWRLKRYLPVAYFSLMKNNARIQFDSNNPSPGSGGISVRLLRFMRERYFG